MKQDGKLIRVRISEGGHVAIWRGRRSSSTSSPLAAARAVARKALDRDVMLTEDHREDCAAVWYRVEEGTAHV
jgi:hypothetical protein